MLVTRVAQRLSSTAVFEAMIRPTPALAASLLLGCALAATAADLTPGATITIYNARPISRATIAHYTVAQGDDLWKIASFYGLAQALKVLPVGTGYAVWTGIGAVGTAIVGVLYFGESRDIGRVLSILLIVCGIVGLKLASRA